VASVTDSYDRILGFLDRSRYFFLASSSSIVLTGPSGPGETYRSIIVSKKVFVTLICHYSVVINVYEFTSCHLAFWHLDRATFFLSIQKSFPGHKSILAR
jgi:hypothetical protein